MSYPVLCNSANCPQYLSRHDIQAWSDKDSCVTSLCGFLELVLGFSGLFSSSFIFSLVVLQVDVHKQVSRFQGGKVGGMASSIFLAGLPYCVTSRRYVDEIEFQ